ncbi:MAG: hypothetical protein R3C28_26330 [Pirellulaceae bacterium]
MATLSVAALADSNLVLGQTFVGIESTFAGTNSRITGMANNGSAVVGTLETADGVESFLWSLDDGINRLGPGIVTDISGNGSRLTGCWDCTAVQQLGVTFVQPAMGARTLLNAAVPSFAHAISDDANMIVGETAGRAFRWSESTGMNDIGTLAGGIVGGGVFTRATDLSSDGRVLVGQGSRALGTEAIRWTDSDHGVGLGRFAWRRFFQQCDCDFLKG